jgi:hypothetical protein
MRYHLTCIRIATIKQQKCKIASVVNNVGKLELCVSLVGIKNGVTILENSIIISQKNLK